MDSGVRQSRPVFRRKAAWAAVEPVLVNYPPVQCYARGSWGPTQADVLIAADGGWQNPSHGAAD